MEQFCNHLYHTKNSNTIQSFGDLTQNSQQYHQGSHNFNFNLFVSILSDLKLIILFTSVQIIIIYIYIFIIAFITTTV